MDRINFDNGNKKIEINDSGDFIIIPMADNSFPERVINFSKKAEEKYSELVEKEIELKNSSIEEVSKMRCQIFTEIGVYFE